MRITILGTGNMGRYLGTRWAELGHDVMFASRTLEKAAKAAAHAGAKYGSYNEAAEFGEVIVHTARGVLLSEMLQDVSLLDGKIVIETNNRPIPQDFKFKPYTEKSFLEQLQADAPNAHIVKAFNTMAQEVFEQSAELLKSRGVSVYVAGDNEKAKSTVSTLAAELGFRPVDFGTSVQGELVEALGDAIRFLIIKQGLGSQATINIDVLPIPGAQRLGGRQASLVDA